MSTLTVKNKRLKVSPKGVITLSAAARKGLGMSIGKPYKVSAESDGRSVLLSGDASNDENAIRVSKGGNMSLGEFAKVLARGEERHYWMEIDDAKRVVKLSPF